LRRLYGDAYNIYERHTHRYFGAPRGLVRAKRDERPASGLRN
jgi:hypothetical protein